MLKKRSYSLFLTGILGIISMSMLPSCLSEIDIDLPQNEVNNIAITGNIVVGNPSRVVISVFNLASYQNSNPALPIDNAQVSLLSETGETIAIPTTQPGLYEQVLSTNFPITIGESYQLKVIIGDKTYQSTLEPLFAVPKVNELSVATISRSELNDLGNIRDQLYLQFFVDTPLAPAGQSNKVSLKWDFLGVYKFKESFLETNGIPPPAKICYNSQKLNLETITVFNAEESQKSILSNALLLEERLDHRFSQGFYLSVFQQSLSKNAARYWEKTGAVTNISGSFFEAPPGKVIGNISNIDNPQEEVFGYFYATQIDTIRIYIPPMSDKLCPGSVNPNNSNASSFCLDCLSRPNSTLERPDYWVE